MITGTQLREETWPTMTLGKIRELISSICPAQRSDTVGNGLILQFGQFLPEGTQMLIQVRPSSLNQDLEEWLPSDFRVHLRSTAAIQLKAN
ncbi:hypothetical protein NKI79_12560 [Mesorhizobium sp. M0340]|uniref:hypothetical protein n=1 Tax=Mesorhizobium sp. M0340 TaxID=2956939 RepID=UPI0033373719